MQAVDPILATEPDLHLLTSIDTLPGGMVAGAFSHGLVFQSGVECAIPATWPQCVPAPEGDDEPREKTTDSFGPDVGFKQFTAYYALECPNGVIHSETEGRWAKIARVTFDAIKHQIVAGQLWWNKAESFYINDQDVQVFHSLKTAAVTLSPTPDDDVADPISVIARLVAAHRKLAGTGATYVHGPIVLVPYLIAQGLIVKQGGRWVGPNFIYVADEGYPDDAGATEEITGGPLTNRDDFLEGDEADWYADTEGECWLYVTGRVEYAWGKYVGTKDQIGENTPDGAAPTDNDGRYSTYTSWGPRLNKTFILVEQQAFLRFDPCNVLAAKAYIPTIAQGEGT